MGQAAVVKGRNRDTAWFAVIDADWPAIIALDKKIGEPVEIMVNGRRIARGEITVLENDDTRFGVKLIEVMATKTS